MDTAPLPAGSSADAAEPGTSEAAQLESGTDEATEHEPGTSEATRHGPDGAGESPTQRPRWVVTRVLTHEWTLASLGSLLLAVAFTWPTLRDPTHTVPQDTIDPAYEAYQVAWGGHALLTNPLGLWHANAFFPDKYSYVFTDTLLGYAPAGMIGTGPTAAVLRYNILFVLLHALAFVGAYALVRQLGSGRVGGVVAGLGYAYAPWRLAHGGHMQVLSNGGIVLALAMLARGHGWSLRYGYRPDRRRPGWALAGWLVATWQVSLGFGLGVPFGYVLGICGVAAALGYCWSWVRRRKRPPFGRKLFFTDLAGAVVFGGITLLLMLPYLRVAKIQHYEGRSLAEIDQFSVPLRGYLVAPGESWFWGDLAEHARSKLSWPPEMTLFPGFTIITLALIGVFVSRWRIHQRVLLALGVAVTVVLGMGTHFLGDGDPGYVTLFRIMPGWNVMRTTGRLVLWTTLLLCVLAAGSATVLTEYLHKLASQPSGRDRWLAGLRGAGLRLALLIPIALIAVESVSTTAHPTVPDEPLAMRVATGPILLLPLGSGFEDEVVLWTTDGYPKIVNGLPAIALRAQDETRTAAGSFPDQASVEYLRKLGIKTVILVPEWAGDSPWRDAANRPVDGLGITREEVNGWIVYRLG